MLGSSVQQQTHGMTSYYHGRSISELDPPFRTTRSTTTLTPPSFTPAQSSSTLSETSTYLTPPHPSPSNSVAAAGSASAAIPRIIPNSPTSSSAIRQHASSHHFHQRREKQQHRRAVSANTVDFMLLHTMDDNLTKMSTSSSPSLSREPSPSTTNNNHHTDTTSTSSTTTARYVCPYCHKLFSRPSSLRIHTYSHTGEKPFVCPEPGCGRRFSVQSNQRRHLRVHRFGRPSSKSQLKDDI
ncbi:uncharacterized protein BX664DRAFT_333176 [Halteromyces radiatus]|uniref:uncharacterized protein n=1 Tax=Halteromyces radiatus TaxID=101107 RepID=UPI0022211E76|nr:uncharacterized protein BX664DRAFT_333176 [Halteromyces radiatus]KAI8089509.1 hypothetical protein BX664DRAFT_333176 [Halteromyces radiatus]